MKKPPWQKPQRKHTEPLSMKCCCPGLRWGGVLTWTTGSWWVSWVWKKNCVLCQLPSSICNTQKQNIRFIFKTQIEIVLIEWKEEGSYRIISSSSSSSRNRTMQQQTPFLPCNSSGAPGETDCKKARPRTQPKRVRAQCPTAQSRAPLTLPAVLGSQRLRSLAKFLAKFTSKSKE